MNGRRAVILVAGVNLVIVSLFRYTYLNGTDPLFLIGLKMPLWRAGVASAIIGLVLAYWAVVLRTLRTWNDLLVLLCGGLLVMGIGVLTALVLGAGVEDTFNKDFLWRYWWGDGLLLLLVLPWWLLVKKEECGLRWPVWAGLGGGSLLLGLLLHVTLGQAYAFAFLIVKIFTILIFPTACLFVLAAHKSTRWPLRLAFGLAALGALLALFDLLPLG